MLTPEEYIESINWHHFASHGSRLWQFIFEIIEHMRVRGVLASDCACIIHNALAAEKEIA